MNVLEKDVETGSEKKSRSRDLRDTHLIYFCIFWFVGLAVNLHTKIEVTNFTNSRYTVYTARPKIIKVGHVT